LVRMVDIGGKPRVMRQALAEGRILLQPRTLEKIRHGLIKKGDVISASQLAGIQAAKRTSDLIPLCHPVPLSGVLVEVIPERDGVRCTCEVSAVYSTGVEMEALTGVAGALLCVWDMVKYLEKDKTGNYPNTSVQGIRVLLKKKGHTGITTHSERGKRKAKHASERAGHSKGES